MQQLGSLTTEGFNMANEFSMADYLAWKELIEKKQFRCSLLVLKMTKKMIMSTMHPISKICLCYQILEDDVKVEEQPKVKNCFRYQFSEVCPFSELVFFWIRVFLRLRCLRTSKFRRFRIKSQKNTPLVQPSHPVSKW